MIGTMKKIKREYLKCSESSGECGSQKEGWKCRGIG